MPTAPARRWRPADQTPTNTSTATRAPLQRSGAFFRFDDHHQPHNQKLKEIRKLSQRRRWRERSGRFVAEGEDLLAAADAAGWAPLERFCAAGSGLPGIEVEPALLAVGLRAGLRDAGAGGLRGALGRRPRPVRCASTCTASTTPATSARSCARRRRSAPPRWRSGRAAPTRSAPRRSAPAWARCSPCRSPACDAALAELPGRTVALVADRGPALSELALERRDPADRRRARRACPTRWSRPPTRWPGSRSTPTR